MSQLKANAKPFSMNANAGSFQPKAGQVLVPLQSKKGGNTFFDAGAKPAATAAAPAATATAPAPTAAAAGGAAEEPRGMSAKGAAQLAMLGLKAPAPAPTAQAAATTTTAPAPTATPPPQVAGAPGGAATESWENAEAAAPTAAAAAPVAAAAPTPAPAPVETKKVFKQISIGSSKPAAAASPAAVVSPKEKPAAAATPKSADSDAAPKKTSDDSDNKKKADSDKNTKSGGAAPAVKNTANYVPTKEQKAFTTHDEREHLNIVFIGHVDAGKSTISGQVLLLTGQVDERTIQKYEKEAKEKGRDSWYLAFIMDTNEEERAKGKTVEVGRAHFTTGSKRYTLLDAPGHKNYVPNMIGGAAQADVGVLVISARQNEFEAGFDRGGQTREHAMLAKTLGISRLVVLINKMDEQTVKWSKDRYDEIEKKLTPFLKKWGYNTKNDVIYCPCSGYTGANLKEPVSATVAPWYNGPSFLQVLDKLKPLERDLTLPVRIPIIARYKEMGGLFVLGKLESGQLYKGQKLLMQPNSVEVEVQQIFIDEVEVNVAKSGENLLLKIKGIEEEDVHVGFVLSPVENPAKRTKQVEAQVIVLDLLEHKPLITSGYAAILHVHTLSIECQIAKLVSEMDRTTNEPAKRRPRFLKAGSVGNVVLTVDETIVVEMFKDFQQLGRFTLRDEGRTIAIGKIVSITEANKTSDQSK